MWILTAWIAILFVLDGGDEIDAHHTGQAAVDFTIGGFLLLVTLILLYRERED